MATTKNSKEVIWINCRDIPETICVETRFITHATATQKKNEQLFYVSNKNGSFELTRQEELSSSKSSTSVPKPSTVTLSLQTKLPLAPVATVQQQCQPNQQTKISGTIVPLVPALTNFNKNNFFNNLSAANSVNSAITATLSNIGTAQMQTNNLNSSVSPAATSGTINSSNIANIRSNVTDKIQQTDVSALNMISIATQCNFSEELEDLDVEWPSTSKELFENCENTETEMQDFLKFINDNSTLHKNCKECLICGELCKSNKYFYGHMAIHQGPKALCFKCGKVLDHENLLPRHKCQKAKQLDNSILQCPNYTCNVKAISLFELYDHINEHLNNRMYKCSACRKSFCTGQEYLRHLLLRAKCYTSAKRKQFRVYGLESQKDSKCRVRVFTLHTFKKCTTLVKTFLSQRKDKKRICKICLKYFPNKAVYSRHRIKCIGKFRKILLQKGRK